MESSTDASGDDKIPQGQAKIYIGKGKYITDDPKKYPNKENGGDLFQGISGGWAGGEVGLKAFTADNKPEPAADSSESSGNKNVVDSKFSGKDVVAEKLGEGEDTLYIGYNPRSPDDIKARKEGAMGKFVIADAAQYPSKEDLGFGEVTGGFAGGEKGLKQFVEKGKIEFLDPSQRSREWSPIVVATIVAGAGSLGTILLSGAFDLSNGIINKNVLENAMDEKTRTIFQVALGLLAVAWIGSTAFATFRAIKEKVEIGKEGVIKVGATVAFWIVVLVAAYELTQI